MLKLTNVQLSSDSRIISDFCGYNESTNRGIRTHNRFGKFFADWFGSGTIKVYIDDKKYYLNRNSCYKLIDREMACKDKELVIGQIQSIFNEMHGGKELIQGRAVGFKNYQIDNLPIDNLPIDNLPIDNPPVDIIPKDIIPITQIALWVLDNRNALGAMAYNEAMGTIKFFQFINTEAGLSDILNCQSGLYFFNPPNFELPVGIPFHRHNYTTKEDIENTLNSLLRQFIHSLNQLKTDKQKTQFFRELNGYCIEAKTSGAFVYATSLESNPDAELEPFYVIANKYRDKAHEALKGQALTIDLLAQYINDNHGGEKCLSDPNLCPDGVISLESAKAFLEITDFDLT